METKIHTNTLQKAIKRQIKFLLKKNPERVFKGIKGIIHVGANTGQEVSLYNKYDLSVIWVEPIPEVFETLKLNIKDTPKQIALKGLVTDIDNAEYQFHLASNNGASSSILDLNLHKDIWPGVIFEKTITLFSKTLPSLLKVNNINASEYDMLVLDTQGSELLVLKGAIPLLKNFKYIKTEAPDFESYKGCCQVKDLSSFLLQYGFIEFSRCKFATHPKEGGYYDVIYKKK
jgi:FkbM family methyltransferase